MGFVGGWFVADATDGARVCLSMSVVLLRLGPDERARTYNWK